MGDVQSVSDVIRLAIGASVGAAVLTTIYRLVVRSLRAL